MGKTPMWTSIMGQRRRVFRREVPNFYRLSTPFVLPYRRRTVKGLDKDLASVPDGTPAPTMVEVIPRGGGGYNRQRRHLEGEEDEEASLLKKCLFVRRKGPKKRATSSLSPLMPDEIMEAILLRLPVRALVRFRRVCRSWRALLSTYDFAARHLDLAKSTLPPTQRVLLFIKRLYYPLPFMGVYSYEIGSSVAHSFISKSIPPPHRLPFTASFFSSARVQHCDGLVLFAYRDSIYVCNPSINQVKVVPPGTPNPANVNIEEDATMICLGFDSFSKEYKLVRCFYHTCEPVHRVAKMRCEVFTLCSNSHSWAAISEDLPFPVMGGTSPVFYNGFVCWKINIILHRSAPTAFLSLCLKDEKFEVIPLPSFPMEGLHEADWLFQNVNLAEINGNLCVVRLSSMERHTTDIWRLDEGCNSNRVWTMWYSINIPNLWNCVMPVGILQEKVLFQTNEGLGYYDLVSEEFENIIDIHPKRVSYSPEVGAFMSSWCGKHPNSFKSSLFLESLIPLGASLKS